MRERRRMPLSEKNTTSYLGKSARGQAQSKTLARDSARSECAKASWTAPVLWRFISKRTYRSTACDSAPALGPVLTNHPSLACHAAVLLTKAVTLRITDYLLLLTPRYRKP